MTRKGMCYLLSLIAYFGMPIGVVFIDSAQPYVLGLPFLLFWMVLWILLGSGHFHWNYYLFPDPLARTRDYGAQRKRHEPGAMEKSISYYHNLIFLQRLTIAKG